MFVQHVTRFNCKHPLKACPILDRKGRMIKEHNVVIRHTLAVQPPNAFADQMEFAC